MMYYAQIGILAFSGRVLTASSTDPCYSNQLSVVNPTTRQQLKDFLNSLYPNGDANYTLAFETAFSILKSSSEDITGQTKKGKYTAESSLGKWLNIFASFSQQLLSVVNHAGLVTTTTVKC
jgi:hypothetical protein